MEEGNWVKIPIKKSKFQVLRKLKKKPLEMIDLKALFFSKKILLNSYTII